MTDVKVTPRLVDEVNVTNMVHWVCDCTPKIGLCGARLRGDPTAERPECVVCQDFAACPRCGALCP